MDWIITWVIPPIVGAVIGYCTNWLAIKMLFKPYNKVKIGGISVPFTPGLIPKERGRIANKIAEAVGNYLLTKEVIINKLKSDNIKNEIKGIINKYIVRFEKGISIDQIAEFMFEKEKDLYLDKLKNKAAIYVTNQLLQQNNREKLYESIYSRVANAINKDKSIGNLIGQELNESLKVFITEQAPFITKEIKKVLAQQEIEDKVKNMLSEVINEKFGALGAMFIDINSIYVVIVEKINSLLEEEEIVDKIRLGLENLYNEVINKDLDDVIANETLQQIHITLSNKIYEEVYSYNTLELINKTITSQLDILIKDSIKIPDDIINLIQDRILKQYDLIVDTKTENILKTIKISEILEEQINAFDIEELEEMILLIVNKELKAITWFGALLGFIMGLILLVV